MTGVPPATATPAPMSGLGHTIFTVAMWGTGAVIVVVVLVLVVVGRMSRRQDSKASMRPGVWAVVGKPGAGKSYLLVREAQRALAAGRPVVANFDIAGCGRADTWTELVQIAEPGSMIIIDEAHGWWPSTAWKAPPELRMWLSQVRHMGLTLVWASQAYERVSKGLRHLTAGVWKARALAGGVHEYRLYDPDEFGRRGAKPQRTLRIRRTDAVQEAYDTTELLLVGCEWDR